MARAYARLGAAALAQHDVLEEEGARIIVFGHHDGQGDGEEVVFRVQPVQGDDAGLVVRLEVPVVGEEDRPEMGSPVLSGRTTAGNVS